MEVHSDPTYEAWKVKNISDGELKDMFIPILPTRHGKSPSEVRISWASAIPILPTRHGKYITALANFSFIFTIPILPTRHGKRRYFQQIETWIVDSDPTYEAWKGYFYTHLNSRDLAFRSYLRGMESRNPCESLSEGHRFRSYLRGMERV